jgi:hypothetical protein
MQTATWLVSRHLTEAAGPWDKEMYVDDDGEYFCRVLLASDGVRFSHQGKVLYRSVASNRLSYIGRSAKKQDAQFVSMERHIRCLRSLEESERTRSASLMFLQTWLPHFYPDRKDIIEKAEALARELGGTLQPPRLSWKYSLIQKLFGWDTTKKAQLILPEIRWSGVRLYDRALFKLCGGIGLQ